MAADSVRQHEPAKETVRHLSPASTDSWGWMVKLVRESANVRSRGLLSTDLVLCGTQRRSCPDLLFVGTMKDLCPRATRLLVPSYCPLDLGT